MSFFEDIYDEFKKGSKSEKAIILGGGAVVLVIAIIMIRNNAANNAAQTSPAQGPTTAAPSGNLGTVGNFGPGGAGMPNSGLQTFPYGSTPVLDSSGNPVAVIGPPPNPTNTGTPTPTGSKSPYLLSSPPSHNLYTFGAQTNINGQQYITGPGGNNVLWGVPIQPGQRMTFQQWQNTPIAPGQKVALYGPNAPQAMKQGGGPFGTNVAAKGRMIAPSHEGQSYIARTYARRIN